MCLSSAAPWFLPLFSCYGPTWRTAAVSWQPGCLPFVALLVDFCATPYTNTHHAFVRHCLGFFFLFFGEGGRGGAAAAELWHEFERSDMCLCSLLFLFVFRRVVPLKNTSKRSPEEWQLIWSFVTHYRASQIQAMLGKKTKKSFMEDIYIPTKKIKIQGDICATQMLTKVPQRQQWGSLALTHRHKRTMKCLIATQVAEKSVKRLIFF